VVLYNIVSDLVLKEVRPLVSGTEGLMSEDRCSNRYLQFASNAVPMVITDIHALPAPNGYFYRYVCFH